MSDESKAMQERLEASDLGSADHLDSPLEDHTYSHEDVMAFAASEVARDRAALANQGDAPVCPGCEGFSKRGADTLADEVDALVRRGVLDPRSPSADALLDYREPPTTPRSDRLAKADTALALAEQEKRELQKSADTWRDKWATMNGYYHDRDKEARELRAEVERLHGIQPELPPMPPEGVGLPRYGLRWNGPDKPLAVPMVDGYWTPCHLAVAQTDDLRAEVEAAKRQWKQSHDCAAVLRTEVERKDAALREWRDAEQNLFDQDGSDAANQRLEIAEQALTAALSPAAPVPSKPEDR